MQKQRKQVWLSQLHLLILEFFINIFEVLFIFCLLLLCVFNCNAAPRSCWPCTNPHLRTQPKHECSNKQ